MNSLMGFIRINSLVSTGIPPGSGIVRQKSLFLVGQVDRNPFGNQTYQPGNIMCFGEINTLKGQ